MKILTRLQIKETEENAVKSGIFSYKALMENAGAAAAKIITDRYDISGKKVCIVCGSGNNGGDGLVIASYLLKAGAEVFIHFPLGLPKSETALFFFETVRGIPIVSEVLTDADFIIDALFGIGLERQLFGDGAKAVEAMNDAAGIKIAVDLPSGLLCDSGECDLTFKADLTISFIAYKLCELLPPACEYCGEIVIADIGAKISDYSYLTIEKPKLCKRKKNSHKGTYGTALLFCGSYGMCGAEILAAKAALRSGVGIVKALVCDKNYAAFSSNVPEAVTIPVETALSGAPAVYTKLILSSISSSDALLLGCGLGTSDEAKMFVRKTIEYANIPTIIDADGINAVATDINILRKLKAPFILTPHPAEMARLCGTTTDEIERHRVKYAKRFATEFGCVLVLKGSNTIVALPNGSVYFNTIGNSGMATGGSGDVLAGMIVSLLAQGYDTVEAALRAVWFHSEAADNALSKITESALIPSDIIEELKTQNI